MIACFSIFGGEKSAFSQTEIVDGRRKEMVFKWKTKKKMKFLSETEKKNNRFSRLLLGLKRMSDAKHASKCRRQVHSSEIEKCIIIARLVG